MHLYLKLDELQADIIGCSYIVKSLWYFTNRLFFNSIFFSYNIKFNNSVTAASHLNSLHLLKVGKIVHNNPV